MDASSWVPGHTLKFQERTCGLLAGPETATLMLWQARSPVCVSCVEGPLESGIEYKCRVHYSRLSRETHWVQGGCLGDSSAVSLW